MKQLLNLWHRNESRGGLRFWFWVLVGPVRKTRQTSTSIFHNLSQKMWFFTNGSKRGKIIYQIEVREETSWYVLVSSLGDEQGERNGHLKFGFMTSLASATSGDSMAAVRRDLDHRRLRSPKVPSTWRKVANLRPNQRQAPLKLMASHARPPTQTTTIGTAPTQGLTFRGLLNSVPWRMQLAGDRKRSIKECLWVRKKERNSREGGGEERER